MTDVTDYKSIQELLNELCSCIAIDENGKSFIRTKAGAGGNVDPTSVPRPGGDSSPKTPDAYIT